MTDARTLYDDDFVAWTEQQAEALRSASRGSTNQPVDWENLAEEIESLGKSDRRELHSQIYRIIRHLAKLSDGDARKALNSLEIAALTTPPGADGIVKLRVPVVSGVVNFGNNSAVSGLPTR